jgi:imidazolonepropionase-like amidohydrolase
MERIITGATLICGENLEEKLSHGLWIKDGKIIDIIHNSEIPSDKQVTHLDGGFLFPGLIDLHVHIMWDGTANPVETHEKESYEQKIIRAISNSQIYIKNGVTTIRDLGSIDDIALHVAESIQRKLIAGPRIIASGFNYDWWARSFLGQIL